MSRLNMINIKIEIIALIEDVSEKSILNKFNDECVGNK
jgi:hypothetical protein